MNFSNSTPTHSDLASQSKLRLEDYLTQIETKEAATPASHVFKLIKKNEQEKMKHDKDMQLRMRTLLSQKDLSKGQRHALLTFQESTEFVIDPSILDPLVSSLDKANRNLKVENSGLRSDLAQQRDYITLLLQDNQKLRQFLTKKNEDIGKIITTLEEQEGSYIQGLKDNIEIINHENTHLTQKMQELAQLLEMQKDQNLDLDLVHKKGMLQNSKLNEDLRDIKLREKTNIEKNQIFGKRVLDLEKALSKEKRDKIELERQLRNLKRQSDSKVTGSGGQAGSPPHNTDLLQEVIILRDEKKYLEGENRDLLDKMRNLRMLPPSGAEDMQGQTIYGRQTASARPEEELQLLQNQLSSAVQEKDSYKVKYENQLNKLKVLNKFGSNSQQLQPSETGNGEELQKLKTELKLKDSELAAMRDNHAENIFMIERGNKDLIDKLKKDNSKLKNEKFDFMKRLQMRINNNDPSLSGSDAQQKTSDIKRLKRTVQELKNELSEKEEVEAKNYDLLLQLTKAKTDGAQNTHDYSSDMAELHQKLTASESKAVQQGAEISGMRTIFEKFSLKHKNTTENLTKFKTERILFMELLQQHPELKDDPKFKMLRERISSTNQVVNDSEDEIEIRPEDMAFMKGIVNRIVRQSNQRSRSGSPNPEHYSQEVINSVQKASKGFEEDERERKGRPGDSNQKTVNFNEGNNVYYGDTMTTTTTTSANRNQGGDRPVQNTVGGRRVVGQEQGLTAQFGSQSGTRPVQYQQYQQQSGIQRVGQPRVVTRTVGQPIHLSSNIRTSSPHHEIVNTSQNVHIGQPRVVSESLNYVSTRVVGESSSQHIVQHPIHPPLHQATTSTYTSNRQPARVVARVLNSHPPRGPLPPTITNRVPSITTTTSLPQTYERTVRTTTSMTNTNSSQRNASPSSNQEALGLISNALCRAGHPGSPSLSNNNINTGSNIAETSRREAALMVDRALSHSRENNSRSRRS